MEEEGVAAALPRGLTQEYAEKIKITDVRLGARGIAKQIFLGARVAEANIDYLKAFIDLARRSEGLASKAQKGKRK